MIPNNKQAKVESREKLVALTLKSCKMLLLSSPIDLTKLSEVRNLKVVLLLSIIMPVHAKYNVCSAQIFSMSG